jgi:hypothetical protein
VEAAGLAVLVYSTLLGVFDPGSRHRAQAQEDEPFLTRPEPSYRGRIEDAATGRPISGALVVVFWEFISPEDGDRRNVWALRELVSDDSGAFAVDARPIETTLPPRAFPPRLIIYKPGYSTIPNEPAYPAGVPARQLLAPSTPIRLRPIRSEDERTVAFNAFMTHVRSLRVMTTAGFPARSYRAMDEELERLLRQGEGPSRPGGSR